MTTSGSLAKRPSHRNNKNKAESPYDTALEAEIDAFYKSVFPEDENGSEELLDLDEIFHDQHLLAGELGTSNEPNATSRAMQMEKLSEGSVPCVFLIVSRMFETYEFQLWDIVPVVTVKELIEDVIGVSPEDMRLYMKPGIVLDNQKMLKEYGIIPELATASNPAKMFVGLRVDLEEVSEEEGAEDEDEDDDESDLTPGLEYFETISDIDFTEETARDRDFDDGVVDVEYSPEYEMTKSVNMCYERQMSIPKEPVDESAAGVYDSDDSAGDSFVPFTLKKA